MKRRAHLLTLLALPLLFFACATGGDGAGADGAPPPEWVVDPPESTAQLEYFLGSASSAEGDVAAAEEQAVADLLAEITRYMGVRVTSESTAEARASLDDFETDVTQIVRQESDARVEGLRVEDRYVERSGDRATVYILASYEQAALAAERARIAALFQERVDAIAVPESQARSLEDQGAYLEAALRYIEAASAAAGSTLENAEIRFERNITAARSIVSELTLEKENDNLSTNVNTPFDDPFLTRVTVAGRPLPEAELLVSYKVLRSNGRTGVATARVRTDSRGVAAFDHPVPQFVGDETLSVGLDLNAYLTPLETAPSRFQGQVDSLLDILASKRVLFRYSVESGAGDVPTAIAILATDIAGNPIDDRATESGLLQRLSNEDFDIRLLSISREELAELDQSAVIDRVREAAGEDVQRVIFGVVGIDEFEERDGIIVRVSGSVTAVRLADGAVLASAEGFQRSRGRSSQSAISAAFRGLGDRFAEELLRELP
ncbi:MAG: hypothetical protein ACOC45_03105 [Alkalispirochaetaceae bacterium]